MNAELSLKGLTKVFEGKGGNAVAVDNINLDVERGNLVTLLGPSGCGKTTTLRMIGGLELPTSGNIVMAGETITNLPPQRRDTVTIFQSYGLFPHMTIFENVAFGLKVRRIPHKEIRTRVDEVLSVVGLNGLGKRLPSELSGGQQQRVALARGLVVRPKVLLFDEPLSNLDAKLRVETREHIRRIQQSFHITAIYVTHDQEEAMAISDQVAVMNAGTLQQIGSPYEIYAHPTNRVVADFIGRASFLKGKIVDVDDRQSIVRLLEDITLNVPFKQGMQKGDPVVAVVRPEAVDIVSVEEGDMTARVAVARYTGSVANYKLLLQGGNAIEVEVMNPQEKGFLAEGTTIGIKFHRQSMHLLKE